MTRRRRSVPAGIRAEHRLSSDGAAFAVWASSAKVMRHFERLETELDLRSLVDRLEVNPHERVPGKTKKLRGRAAGAIQYDLPDGNRAQYVVEGRDVIIVYVGRHPKKGG